MFLGIVADNARVRRTARSRLKDDTFRIRFASYVDSVSSHMHWQALEEQQISNAGTIDDWPARQIWCASYLREKLGDCQVHF